MKTQGEVNMGNGKLEKLNIMENMLWDLRQGKIEENRIEISCISTEDRINYDSKSISLMNIDRHQLTAFIEKQVELLRIEVLKDLGVYDK